MALIVVVWLIVASGLAFQGVYTLRTGQATWFFIEHPSHAPMSSYSRMKHAFVYLLSALCILVILARMLTGTGVKQIVSWVTANYGLIFVSLSFMIFGIVYLAHPEKSLRWAIPHNPELWDNKYVQVTARIICIVFIAVSAIILAKL